MNSATPIKIFRGDDTDAFGLRTITIKLSGDLDLTNATASFSILGHKVDFDNATTKTGELTLAFSKQTTKTFPLGPTNGSLKLYDNQKQLTIVNTIPFEIVNKVFGAPTQEYSINVQLAVDTEVDITFKSQVIQIIDDTNWEKSGAHIKQKDTTLTVDIQKLKLYTLNDTASLGSKYTLADVKTLVNTILAALKG